jgi:hypothetical protein
MKCRLKVNTISGGKFIKRDSIVDDSILPEHLRTDAYVADDLADRSGKVLLLRDLSFMSLPRSSASGIATSFPVHLAAGELLELNQVPASKRESLVEGLDYKTDWTFEEAAQLQKAQEDIYAHAIETEPTIPT